MNTLNCYGYKENTSGLVSLKTQFKTEQDVVDKKQDKKINELGKLINEESGETLEKAVSIEYDALKVLRDKGELVPGQFYRITDYETTTSERDTQSAGHLFDIIVLALDNKTLSEDAAAIQSARDSELSSFEMGGGDNDSIVAKNDNVTGEYGGESYYEFITTTGFPVYVKTLSETPTISTVYLFTNNGGPCFINENPTNIWTVEQQDVTYISNISYGYFGHSNLAAWQLKYCLDNDSDRFIWAKDDKKLSIFINDIDRYGYRNTSRDIKGLYAWEVTDKSTYYMYSFDEKPKVGDLLVFADSIGEREITAVGNNSIAIHVYSADEYYTRETSLDKYGLYGWMNESVSYNEILFTDTETPNVGDVTSASANQKRTVGGISWGGKGVIYRMVDEFNNDFPYDFKNIQFKRWKVEDSYYFDRLYVGFDFMPDALSIIDNDDFIWCYTFSSNPAGGEQEDLSLSGENNILSNMVLGIKYLSNTVFFGDTINLNNFYCPYSNTIIGSCMSNETKGSFEGNVIGAGFEDNVIGNYFRFNMIKSDFKDNTIENKVQDNIIGNNFSENSVKNYFYSNTIGNNCLNNSFSNRFTNNTIGNYCEYSSFGNNVYKCTMNNYFIGNHIGDYCNNINVNKDYVASLMIENGNKYITLTSTQTTSYSSLLGNISIAQGVNNVSTVKTISHDSVNNQFKTTYQSSGSTTINV